MAAGDGVRAAAAPSALTADALNPGNGAPLYEQLFRILRDRIRAGAYKPGELLPGEQELARTMGLSRITVKRALYELAVNGFVTRQRGRGTVVTHNPAAPVVTGSFETLLETLTLMGLTTAVELIEARTTPAEPEVAALLNIKPGAQVQRAKRVRRIEGESFSFLITSVPEAIARAFDPVALAHRPLLQLLEEAGHTAVEAEQWITAAAAGPEAAKALNIAPGSPLLRIVRVMRDAEGKGIEALEAFYRPERFQHHMRMTRKRGRGGRDVWI